MFLIAYFLFLEPLLSLLGISFSIPVRLLSSLECYVNGLCLGILTRHRLALLNGAIRLQERFDVVEARLQRYATD